MEKRIPLLSCGALALSALFSGACVCTTTAAPPPAAPAPAAEVYYEAPEPVAVVDYQPGVIWYFGMHPLQGGGWCSIAGAHTHPWEPAYTFNYYFSNGYYYYVGDPVAYGYATYYQYNGPHPNPWGGWCFIQMPHNHYYPPAAGVVGFTFRAGVWVWGGPFDDVYYRERVYYNAQGYHVWTDVDGHRVPVTAYHEHEVYRAQLAAHPGEPVHIEASGHVVPLAQAKVGGFPTAARGGLAAHPAESGHPAELGGHPAEPAHPVEAKPATAKPAPAPAPKPAAPKPAKPGKGKKK